MLRVYENRDVRPAAFIPQSVRGVDAWDDAFFSVIASGEAVVECGCGAPQGYGTISDISESFDRLGFTVRADADVWAFTTLALVPGWYASIDGAPTRLYYGNYLSQAIRVPAGEHRIEITYHSPTLQWSGFDAMR
jgi:hypothetical protein